MKLHASGEDYLEASLVLHKKMGMVRSVDVARHIHFLHLTDVGRKVAEKIYERHCFFAEQLIAAGVDPKTAEADACRIEHVISQESFQKIKDSLESKVAGSVCT